MTNRFYLVPMQTNTIDGTLYRGPKYFHWRGTADPNPLRGIVWDGMDYGLSPSFLVRADLTDEQHAALTANSDIVMIQASINAQITNPSALSAVQSILESRNIPAGWITTDDTYRTVLRTISGCFQFAQRWHQRYNRQIFSGGITLDTQFRNLPVAVRAEIVDVADDMNIDRTGASGTTTLRQILKAFADAWTGNKFLFGGVEL